jgi:hypothetical protein
VKVWVSEERLMKDVVEGRYTGNTTPTNRVEPRSRMWVSDTEYYIVDEPAKAIDTEDAWDELFNDLQSRRDTGEEEYGVSQVVGPDAYHDWLQHHYEELLDAAYYVKCQLIQRREQARDRTGS